MSVELNLLRQLHVPGSTRSLAALSVGQTAQAINYSPRMLNICPIICMCRGYWLPRLAVE